MQGEPLSPSRGIVARGPCDPGRISQATLGPSIPAGRGSPRHRRRFGLPDRDDPLDLVHRPGARGKGLAAMRGGARDDRGILADRDAADPVHDRHLEDLELRLRALDERGERLLGHRHVHLVVQGAHARVGPHAPQEQDDRTGVVPPDPVHDGRHVDAGPLDRDHVRPPLTGGITATSSPSCKTTSGAAYFRFTAKSIVSAWSASRGYARTRASKSSRSRAPSGRVHGTAPSPAISRYVAKSRTRTRMASVPMAAGRISRCLRAAGAAPGSPPVAAAAPRPPARGTRRGPRRAAAGPPRVARSRGTATPGPGGRRVPRSARSTGTADRGSPSWSGHSRSARPQEQINLT